jgi:uncharacterized protein
MTTSAAHVDDVAAVPRKATTTVAMDFGRLTLDEELILYLFGTPGQQRFWFMWDDLVRGALGAVVLTDTRRLADCFSAIDYFEQRRLPFLVAVNTFDGVLTHSPDDIREALALSDDTAVLVCDARDRESTKTILIRLVEHVMERTATHLSLPVTARPALPRL